MSIFQTHKTMWIVAAATLVAVLATAAALALLSTGPERSGPSLGGTNRPGKTPTGTQALSGVPEAAWRREFGAGTSAGVSELHIPQIDDGPLQGAPIGGLGAGSIGRSYRGAFTRWHLAPGENVYSTAWADQFSVRVARPATTETSDEGDGTGLSPSPSPSPSPAARNSSTVTHVLLPSYPPTSALSSWSWGYLGGAGTYAALYPFAWYHYPQEAAGVTLTSRQFSPVIPNNYKESSYPVALFEWTVSNDAATPADVSLMFTWENPLGWDDPANRSAGNFNSIRRDTLDGKTMLGVVMGRGAERGSAAVTNAWDGQFVIAALQTPGVELSALGRFETSGDGAEVWQPWAQSGTLPNTDDLTPATSLGPIGAALAAGTHLAPGESRKITFVLAWDLPLMQFGTGGTGMTGSPTKPEQWYRRYTEWFGKDGHHAWDIAATGLREADNWSAQIEAWQAPFLADKRTPLWYKTALFNELYYFVDGGTIWENGRVGDDTPSRHRFSYLECLDYDFYSTLGVRFYASYAELMLWPELEKGEMITLAETIPESDPTRYVTKDEAHRMEAVRKVPGSAPHDVGSPREAPWTRINAYDYQDVNNWKDQNSNFVLLVYRDYIATNDRSFLDATWPAVRQALAYLKTLDKDGDGIPENTNFPDQNYDAWVMDGISAYCGSLWLAALEAGAAMADIEGAADMAAQYRGWFAQAQPRFEQALWNGKYYDFDTGKHFYHDSIMADQLAGEWYAGAVGLQAIVPTAHARSALDTIFKMNVQGFQGGQMGAVNGVRPDGSPDTSNIQSLEVWSGTTYALAAFMLQQGLDADAWATAYGVYKVTYETGGYWFRTPEAWDAAGDFRASMYMRPQAIWAMQWALEHR